MSVYLRAKFEVSSITVTSFGLRVLGGREGGRGEQWRAVEGSGGSYTFPPQNEPLKCPQIRVKIYEQMTHAWNA